MRIVLAIIFLICTLDAFSQEPTLDDDNAKVAPKSSPSKPLAKPSKVLKKKPSVVRTRGIISGGLGVVAEKSNDNRTFEPRTLLFGRGGVEHGQHEFLLEVGGFKQETGSSGVTVSRLHQQVDFWYHFLMLSQAKVGSPYIGIGVGAQRDEVSTNLFGPTTKSVGAFEAQLSVGAGYRLSLGESLALWLEGRLATSNNYQPRVLPSAIVAIGVRL